MSDPSMRRQTTERTIHVSAECPGHRSSGSHLSGGFGQARLRHELQPGLGLAAGRGRRVPRTARLGHLHLVAVTSRTGGGYLRHGVYAGRFVLFAGLGEDSAVDPSTAAAVLSASSSEALTPREEALAAWARKVVGNPNGTTAQDVGALRAADCSERDIFEATTFIAFRLAFSTVNDALGVEPDRQIAEAAPPEVQNAVRYGRATARQAGGRDGL